MDCGCSEFMNELKKRLFETTKSHYGRGLGSNPVEVLNFSGFYAQPLELRSQL